ncbi:radical SAM protein [Kitasatospora sp. NPDC101183]|uniref:radical SAM protein n=1 Tax=Kitasatospora sp. NPDC101183 TaxID=3364100 RepID=UPI0037FD0479
MTSPTTRKEPQVSPATSARPLGLVILKVAGRCNLDCTYCYEFNLADQTLAAGPKTMSQEVFSATIERVRRHAERSGQRSVTLSFHGGEPCLIGAALFDRWCTEARRELAGLRVKISMQTNGTLLNAQWIEVLLRHGVDVGVSLDGPPDVHDTFRVRRNGSGSYRAVRRGLDLLHRSGVPYGILAVVQLGADPLRIHRHFLDIGCRSVSYLMPDMTHDTIGGVREEHGPTPCADYLIPIFEHWWHNSTLEVRIRNFWEVSRLILGGTSHVDALGNIPLGFVVVNPSGEVEGLDVLKACEDGMTRTGITVLDHEFADLATASPLHGRMVFEGAPLPGDCVGCVEQHTCAGGYHPHRYSKERGFDNRSVWCADLLKIFAHLRSRLDVEPRETLRLRRELGRPVGV